MALTSLADAKTHCGVTGVTDDAVITGFIAAATEAMEQRAGRHLDAATVTEYLTGTGASKIWLQEPVDVAGITSLHMDSNRTYAAASLVAAADYVVDGCVVDYINNTWLTSPRCIKVVYPTGFATVPADLVHASRVQVAKLYSEWQAAKAGLNILSEQNVQGWSQSWLGHRGLDPEVEEIVDRYTSPRI
ncbi:MAG TPA: head-tail connector protein [Vicinamibacterales bacterium]|nr:head-tail connector protein [Vicinamibacterales bacterium]